MIQKIECLINVENNKQWILFAYTVARVFGKTEVSYQYVINITPVTLP